MSHRENAEAVSSITGASDAHAEALTRLLATGSHSGYTSLTQADFDAVQDAFDDSLGRPRRKHAYPTLWKIKHWWHWHVTSPIIYPLTDDVPRAITWHLVRKHRPGACHLIIGVTGIKHRAYAQERLTWRALRRRARDVQHAHPGSNLQRCLKSLYFLDLPDEAAAHAYRARHHVTTPIEKI